MYILLESSIPAIWTKVEVIAEATAAVGILFTLFYSVWSFTRALRDSYYAELDRVYFEILKIALERPYLVNFAAIPDSTKQREYDTYAFMVWNFLETVFDRCQGLSRGRLRDTWYPVVGTENNLHREWFDNNRSKFKPSFAAFIEREYPRSKSVDPAITGLSQ